MWPGIGDHERGKLPGLYDRVSEDERSKDSTELRHNRAIYNFNIS